MLVGGALNGTYPAHTHTHTHTLYLHKTRSTFPLTFHPVLAKNHTPRPTDYSTNTSHPGMTHTHTHTHTHSSPPPPPPPPSVTEEVFVNRLLRATTVSHISTSPTCSVRVGAMRGRRGGAGTGRDEDGDGACLLMGTVPRPTATHSLLIQMITAGEEGGARVPPHSWPCTTPCLSAARLPPSPPCSPTRTSQHERTHTHTTRHKVNRASAQNDTHVQGGGVQRTRQPGSN